MNTEEVLKQIQQAEITWIETASDRALYDAIFLGEHVQLRVNDFPDEVAYTLFIRDEDFDLEERPRGWHFQHNET